MIKRRVFLSVFALFILGIVLSVGWMAGTSRGNKFVITNIIKFIPAEIEIGNVTGILTDNLRIDDIRVHFLELDIRIKTMELSMQPGYLTAGELVFKKAVFTDVSIISLNPDSPVDIIWPKIPSRFSWVKGRIKKLSFNKLVFFSKDKENVKIENFNGEVLLRFGNLAVKNASTVMPFGRLEGSADAGFIRPSLSANIKLTTIEPVATFDNLLVTMKLNRAKNPEYVSGAITVDGMSGTNPIFLLKGSIAITNNAIKFKEMLLTENGREGEAIINGVLDLVPYEPVFDLNIKLFHINFSNELNVKTSLSGEMHVKGNSSHYSGDITVRNSDKTWKDISLKSTFEGDSEQIQLKEINGEFLDGTMKGFLRMAWGHDFSLSAGLKCRDINPLKIAPGWHGKINTDASAAFHWPEAKPMEGTLKAEFLQSVLRDKALTGKLDAGWQKGVLHINTFKVSGDGFNLYAAGILKERINYEAQVNNLSGLVPGSKGRFAARGWVRLKNNKVSGSLKGRGSSLLVENIHAGSADVEAEIDSDNDNRITANIKVKNLSYRDFNISLLAIDVNGSIAQHTVNIISDLPENNILASFSGGYKSGIWEGNINQLEAKNSICGQLSIVKSSPLRIGPRHFKLGSLSIINNKTAERLDADIQISDEPMQGFAKVMWQNLNVARINPFISKIKLSGNSSGSIETNWLPNNKLRMTGTFGMNGGSVNGSAAINIAKVKADFKWDEGGLDSSGNVDFDSGGNISVKVSSKQPARMNMPDSGDITGKWKDVNLSALKPWLPASIEVKGSLSGKLSGKFLPGSRFDIAGDSKMSGGRFVWKKDGGRIAFSTEKADMGFTWKESFIKGELAFVLPSHGHINGSFKLPMPAVFPLRLDRTGPIRIESSGKVREKGVVSAVFQGLVEETKGLAGFEVTASGSWEKPDYKGWFKLEQGGAFLPAPGIHLKDLAVEAELDKEQINISSFRASSGKGTVNGSAMVTLKDWKIEHYKGKLTGNNFQAVYVPEIQLMVNPDLTFEGNLKNLSIKGTVEVPEATVSHVENKGTTRGSPDVVIVDVPQRMKKPLKFDFNASVMVILGDKVRVKAPGIEARLEGSFLISGQEMDKIFGDGWIKIVDGQYNGYGTKLDVTRGNIVFSGKPVELASLDIMALRSINPGRFNEIKAGVMITGTPQAPLINLYSEPSMSETDILSYIVLGRPIRSEGESDQSAMLLRSAGAFISGGKSGSLQSKLMQKIGIDTFDVETKTSSGTGASGVGSSGIKTGAADAVSARGGSTMTRSIVTVGKYLAPGLYVSYGRSLFTEEHLITARYSFSRSFEIESKTGIETGVDLYYKIEFD
jgi:translocation and assembly module TamB